MNSIKTELVVLNDYLKQQENLSVNTVRVLENVGEFESIIKFPQFSEFDTIITLQVPVGKKLKESNLVVNLSKNFEKKLNSSEVEEIKKQISEFLTSNNDEFLLKSFFSKTYELISEQYKVANKTEAPKAAAAKTNKSTKSLSKKQESTLKNEETATNATATATAEENTKLCSMKRASDVVKRIQWDTKINSEFIIVGYLDRFLGVKEVEYDKFDWGDIVLADIGALAIPEHRIQYFKYKNEVIWDKNHRLDNVYGSTGSNITIYDVIERLADVEYHYEAFEEEVNRVGRPKPAKTTPNYFISVPIHNKDIKLNYRKLSKIISNENSELEDILLPESSLHVTVCTLRIDSSEEMETVRQVLTNIDKNGDLKRFLPIEMNFKNLGTFYDKVLHVKCNCERMEKFNSLRDFILEKLKREKINLAGNYYDFVPHLTILKINSKFLNNNGFNHSDKENISDFISDDLLKKHQDYDLGSQIVDELELCKMTSSLPHPVEFLVDLRK